MANNEQTTMRVRTLSSGLTLYYKFLLVPFLVLGGLFAVAMLWSLSTSQKGHEQPPFPAWIFLIVWLGLAALLITRIIRWKRVRLDTTFFHISNYFRQVQVPLRQLSGISELRGLGRGGIGPRTIVLSFRPPTAFGESIRFKPRLYPWFWRAHPLVAELQAIAAGAPLLPAELDRAIARDRKWLLTGIALFAGFFASFFLVMQWSFLHSEAYRLGLEAINRDPAVVEALGAPVEPGWISSGEISNGLDNGCAALQLGLHGTRAKGDAGIHAYKDQGQWQLYHVWVEVDGRPDHIEVLDRPPTGGGKRCVAQPACPATNSQPALSAEAGNAAKCPRSG